MAINVNLVNKEGRNINSYVGFSWETLFFGFLIPLFRGDFIWAIVMVLCSIFTFGLSILVFPFIYNRIYTNNLLNKGYVPADDYSRAILKRYNLY